MTSTAIRSTSSGRITRINPVAKSLSDPECKPRVVPDHKKYNRKKLPRIEEEMEC